MPCCWRIRIPRDAQTPSELDPAIQKEKRPPLSVEYKAHNKALSKQRVFIEHVNRRCKISGLLRDVLSGQAQELLADMEFSGGSC